MRAGSGSTVTKWKQRPADQKKRRAGGNGNYHGPAPPAPAAVIQHGLKKISAQGESKGHSTGNETPRDRANGEFKIIHGINLF
jgi:hypothetical protein